jgi:multidrug efflux pump subunit AcrB
VLTIEFKHGEDTDKKYEEVVREVNAARAELPQDIYRLQIQKFSSSDVSILQGAIVSENASWADLRREAERLEEDLEKIPGIKAADTWGFPKREVRIALNLPKMAAENVPAAAYWAPCKAKIWYSRWSSALRPTFNARPAAIIKY